MNEKEITSRRGFMPNIIDSAVPETVSSEESVAIDKFLELFYNTQNFSVEEIDYILSGVHATIASNPDIFAKEFNSYTPMDTSQASSLRSIIEGGLPLHRVEEINGVKIVNLIASLVDNARDIYGDGDKQNAARATMIYIVYGLLNSFIHIDNKEQWIESMKEVLLIKQFVIEHNGEDLKSLSILKNLQSLITSVKKAIEIPTERPKPGIGMITKIACDSMHGMGSDIAMISIYKWISSNVE